MEREVLWAHRPAHHLADALRAALCQGPAPGLADPARPLPLRPYRRPQAPAGDAHARHAQRSRGQAAEAAGFTTAFEYSDGWVNDARLVVLNARDAADRGAAIRTRTKVVSARRDGRGWRSRWRIAPAARVSEVKARLIVNAAGPWVDRVLDGTPSA
jgi:glycerol-3-phosphate dehydrogenase